jgi:hypothetical protein
MLFAFVLPFFSLFFLSYFHFIFRLTLEALDSLMPFGEAENRARGRRRLDTVDGRGEGRSSCKVELVFGITVEFLARQSNTHLLNNSIKHGHEYTIATSFAGVDK